MRLPGVSGSGAVAEGEGDAMNEDKREAGHILPQDRDRTVCNKRPPDGRLYPNLPALLASTAHRPCHRCRRGAELCAHPIKWDNGYVIRAPNGVCRLCGATP